MQNKLALLAWEKANDPMFKVFAEMIVNHHVRFQYNIGRLAMAYEIPIPKGLTSSSQQTFDRIENLPPEKFENELLKWSSKPTRKT